LLPSNFETVVLADAIVLGKAVEITEKNRASFEVERVLKGKVEETSLILDGNSQWRGASDPEDFSRPRQGAGAGACIAYDYRLKSRFLLFLSRSGKEWYVSMIPFARVNEEVSGADAPWVLAVTEYVRIAALAVVEDRKKGLRELAESTKVPGLKVDIARHFQRPHGSKPFEDLKELYDHAQSEDARDRVLWAFANGKHASAGELMRTVLASDRWKDHVEAISAYAAALSDPVLLRSLILTMKDGGIPEGIRSVIVQAVADGGDVTVSDHVLELFRNGNDEEAWLLSRFFQRNPRPEAAAELRRRVGQGYIEKQDLTYKLAALGDPVVVEWALKDWKNPGDKRWIPVGVLAISPLGSADDTAQAIIRGNSDAVDLLAQGYADSTSPHRVDRLLQIFHLKPANFVARGAARRSLESLAYWGDTRAKDELEKLPDPEK
jgi:hypothetical protein